MRFVAVLLAGAAAAGCFSPDLQDGQVVCGTGGLCPPNYVCRTSDQRCVKMAGGGGGGGGDMVMTPPDMVMVPLCQAAAMRVCSDSGHSAICSAANIMPTVDRTCPPGSTCSAGYCQPPMGALICKKSADCSNGDVCTPFVIAGVVDTRCAPPLPGATGGIATSCVAVGFDPKCKSGYCARAAGNNICDVPCNNMNDCGGGACDAATLAVEGTNAMALKTCGP